MKKKLWRELVDAWERDTPACQVYLAENYTTKFPDDFFGWVALADGLTRLSSFKRAAEALCLARRLSSFEYVDLVYSRLGHYYREKGDLVRAERWYRKAVASSESQEHLVFLGACLAKQGRYAESQHYHERAVEIDPQKADEALYNLGLVYRAESRYVEALRCFEKAIELDPDYHDAKIARNDIQRVLNLRFSEGRSNRRKGKQGV